MDDKKKSDGLLSVELIDTDSGSVISTEQELKQLLGGDAELVTNEEDLAVGISFPTTLQAPADYLKNITEYKFTKDDYYKKAEVCEKMYFYEGIIGTTVDMLIDVANTELLLIDQKDEKVSKLLTYFLDDMNKGIQTVNKGSGAFVERGMLSYIVYGNVYPYESWRSVKFDGTNYQLPNVVYLNPKAVKVDDAMVSVGIEKLSIELDINALKGIDPQFKKEQIKFKGGKGEVPLEMKNVRHIKRKGMDWEPHGTPMLVRSFPGVSSKKRLKRLDDATTEGLINYLTVFKIGVSDAKSPYHKVSAARLTAFKNLINSPTASTTLVWPHDIDVITAGPDGKVLDFKDKYAQANAEILASLGIGAGIISGSNMRTSEEKLLVFIETLESIREPFVVYMSELLTKIAVTNKLIEEGETVQVKFSNIKVQDILQRLKSIILSYYDRGLISYETALTLGGHSFKQEVERKESETDVKKKGLFEPPNLPFSTQKEETPKQTRDDGRPKNDVRIEKPKIDNDVKLDKPQKNIGEYQIGFQDYISSYHEGLMVKYAALRDRIIKEIIDSDEFDENKFDMLLAAGFISLKKYTQSGLKIAYDAFNEDLDVDEKDLMFQKLYGWNTFYLDKFKKTLASMIKKGVHSLTDVVKPDVELITILAATVFDGQMNRISMYAEEGFYKAKMAGTLETQARDEVLGGFWETMRDDKVCPACSAKEDNWYTLSEIFDEYPTHPRCRCEMNWTHNNPILDEAEKNNDPVVVDPKNPNRPL